MNRQIKEKQAETLHSKLSSAQAAILADYTGINVPSIAKLRKDCRANAIDFYVVKNTVFKRALKDTKFDQFEQYLDGPTSIAISQTDPVTLAKRLVDFARIEQNLKVKVGVLDGRVVNIDEIRKIAQLPSREVLLAVLLSTMKSPHRKLVFVLNGIISKFVNVLSEIAKKKETPNQ